MYECASEKKTLEIKNMYQSFLPNTTFSLYFIITEFSFVASTPILHYVISNI